MSELQDLLGQHQMVAAMLLAADHRQTVMRICATVDGKYRNVMQALVDELGVDEFQAQVILDMQMKKFTPAAIAQVRSELDAIEARLALLEKNEEGPTTDS